MDCPSCGAAAARPDQHYCARCGTTLAPVEPPTAYDRGTRISGPLFADDFPPPPPPPPPTAPPPTQPTPEPPPASPPPVERDRSRPMRPSIVLLVAAAVVAALIGAGGVMLLLGGDDDEPTEAKERSRAGAGTATDDAPTSPANTEPSNTGATKEPPQFRCWNGDGPVNRLADCPLPSGPDGMAWVFPSVLDDGCSVRAGAARATEADCIELVEGSEVRFHYSEWRSRAALEAYYGRNETGAVGTLAGNPDLTVVEVISRDPAVDYKVAIYYEDPSTLWSVTVYAADQAQFFYAEGKVEARRLKQIRGERL
ncbi:hypothetical protein DJ010_19875 [Nocardioides silvaticus]|uniref:Uncharacterized protein n=1 Tax=Nocardioides silvaticus TaxID=2201891 RepID=A0A316T9Y1_9ACTN|nr:hypothetical protein [Nocardioides silvaticus]PWN01113.1 hypothetical protein DJ010_19875 [Nocardioides silvaticus]